MKNLRSILYVLFFTCLSITTVLAQGECADIVPAALEAAAANCDALSRNQACYGNNQIEAQPQAWVTDFTFTQNGDVVDVAAVQNLSLSAFEADAGLWGVALMSVQANLPDTLPGQNVTFLLFGQVELTNAVETNAAPVQLPVAAVGAVNIRRSPSTDGTVIASLTDGETIVADGRLADGTWLRVRLPEGGTGWLFTELVTADADLTTLNTVDASASFEPMQAVYFQSGIGDAACADVPESGVLIQTPEGVGEISLRLNEVDIRLGSTIFVQAQAGGDMLLSVIEGHANVTAAGATVSAPAGTRVRIPLDNNLHASGVPIGPEPYLDAVMSLLPVSLLPRLIEIVFSLTESEIALFGVPRAGIWSAVVSNSTCPDVFDPEMEITVSEDGSTIYTDNGTVMQRIALGVYAVDTPTNQLVLQVITPERVRVVVRHPDDDCGFEVDAQFSRDG